VEFAYLDGAAFGVPHVELLRVPPAIMTWFDSLRSAAAGG
jgi:hypothetical protein